MEVDLSEDPEFNEYGSDTIQLLFQANTGFR
jgi:DNA repair protein RecN (Recombination protein N)